MEEPPTLDFCIMHLDRCDSDDRFDQYQCIDIEQPAEEGMLMVSGEADIDFQYIKINANDEAAAYFNKLDLVSMAYSWKTATQGRYYECYAQDDHLDYTFQPLNDSTNQHDVVFSGDFLCQFCNELWIAEENRWTCVPEANANPEVRIYASGALRAPMVTPQEVSEGFAKQLDMFLTININFLNQPLPR